MKTFFLPTLLQYLVKNFLSFYNRDGEKFKSYKVTNQNFFLHLFQIQSRDN